MSNDLSELAWQDQELHSSYRLNADCKLLLCEGHSNLVDGSLQHLGSHPEASEWDNLSHEWQELSHNTKLPTLPFPRDGMLLLCCIMILAKF